MIVFGLEFQNVIFEASEITLQLIGHNKNIHVDLDKSQNIRVDFMAFFSVQSIYILSDLNF